MNLQETIELLRELRASGATYFKSNDFEIRLNDQDIPQLEKKAAIPIATDVVRPEPPEEYDIQATKEAMDLIDKLKLDDEALANKLFPDGAM